MHMAQVPVILSHNSAMTMAPPSLRRQTTGSLAQQQKDLVAQKQRQMAAEDLGFGRNMVQTNEVMV